MAVTAGGADAGMIQKLPRYRHARSAQLNLGTVRMAEGVRRHGLCESGQACAVGHQTLNHPCRNVLALMREKEGRTAVLGPGLTFSHSDTAESLVTMGQALLAEYVNVCDFEVVDAEHHFEVPLCDPDTGELLTAKSLVGIFDLMTPHGIVELKTAKSVYDPSLFARHLQLSAWLYPSWPAI